MKVTKNKGRVVLDMTEKEFKELNYILWEYDQIDSGYAPARKMHNSIGKQLNKEKQDDKRSRRTGKTKRKVG